MKPYCDATERLVCDQCSAAHTNACPCPMDALLLLVVQAVEAVDGTRGGPRACGERRHCRVLLCMEYVQSC